MIHQSMSKTIATPFRLAYDLSLKLNHRTCTFHSMKPPMNKLHFNTKSIKTMRHLKGQMVSNIWMRRSRHAAHDVMSITEVG